LRVGTRPSEIRGYRMPRQPVIPVPASVTSPIRFSRSPVRSFETANYGWNTVASFNYAFDGRQTIDLGCEGRQVGTLRIFSADPNSEVFSVLVHYADGSSHEFLWNHMFGDSTDGQ